MNKASAVALAIGAGYLLGRKHKLRMAMIVASAAATGRVGDVAANALKRGGSLAGSPEVLGKLSPDLTKVLGTMRGELADAGKAAVKAAVASRIESVTDSLHDRAEGLRNPDEPDEEEQDQPDELDRRGGAERPRGRSRGETRPSARRNSERSRQRKTDDRGGDRPRRRRDPEGNGEIKRPARQSSADGESKSSSTRRRGK